MEEFLTKILDKIIYSNIRYTGLYFYKRSVHEIFLNYEKKDELEMKKKVYYSNIEQNSLM